jgi:iron(III) transport system ATP-binding protein
VIAVMNGGRIEQAGSPEEIYEHPRSEFVARFIGASNVIKADLLDDGHVSFAGAVLRCSGGRAAGAGAAALSIRPHAIRLWPKPPGGTENVVPATVLRQVFLGASRDYMVATADGTQLRVIASTAENMPQGTAVWLHLPPECCRVLSG